MAERRVRKIPKEVAMKPVAWDQKTGSFVPLGQIISVKKEVEWRKGMMEKFRKWRPPPVLGPAKEGILWLDELEGEIARKLVAERLRSEPEDTEVGVIQGCSYTRDELLQEVIAGTPIGERFVRIEKAGIARIRGKIAEGEYEFELT